MRSLCSLFRAHLDRTDEHVIALLCRLAGVLHPEQWTYPEALDNVVTSHDDERAGNTARSTVEEHMQPFTNERTGRTEWLTPSEARNRPELRRQSHRFSRVWETR